MRKKTTHNRILEAVVKAADEHGVPNTFGLAELEVHYRGPSCGAAGAAVRKWPADGIKYRGMRLTWRKDGRRTVVVVQREGSEKKAISDGLADEAAYFLLGTVVWSGEHRKKRTWVKDNPSDAVERIHLRTAEALEDGRNSLARHGADLVLQFCKEGHLPGAGFKIPRAMEGCELSDLRRPLYDRLQAVNDRVKGART